MSNPRYWAFPRDAWKVPAMIGDPAPGCCVPRHWKERWWREHKARYDDDKELLTKMRKLIDLRDDGVPGICCSMSFDDLKVVRTSYWQTHGRLCTSYALRFRQLVRDHHLLLE